MNWLKKDWKAVSLCWLLASLGQASGAQPAFTASLDRSTIHLSEEAQLTLTFYGEPPKKMDMASRPRDLEIGQGSQEQSVQIIQGQTIASWIYTFSVKPTRIGKFRIPPITATFPSRTLVSQPLELTVVEAGGLTDLAQNSQAFLRLVVPEKTVYVGQSFVVEIQLYVVDARDIHMPQLQAEGFTFGKPVQAGQSLSQIRNRVYHVVTFKIPATAVKAGSLKLGPAECTLALRRSPLRNDYFDIFAEWDTKTLTSDTLPMQVLPLPSADQPPNFTGAVGKFTMQVAASPTNVVAGDPVTLHVIISGTGALETLNLRDRPDWPGFKVYPPKSDLHSSDPLGLAGVKRFEQVIVPDNSAITSIPEIDFSYFDPETGSYETLRHPPIGLRVRPVAAPQPVVAAGKPPPAPLPPPEMVHIKPVFGAIQTLEPPLVLRPWFLAVQSLPLLGWLSLFVLRKRRQQSERNPRWQRRRRVQRDVQRMLEELADLARRDRPDDFFGLAFRILQEQIGERLDLPSSAITEAVLEQPWPGQPPGPELEAQLEGLFQLCNQARYAPQRTTRQLLELVPKFKSAVAQLQRLPSA